MIDLFTNQFRLLSNMSNLMWLNVVWVELNVNNN